MADLDSIPEYEPMLAAYHRAYAGELQEVIVGLPLRRGDRVLEMACGAGAYSGWLAERVAPTGNVLALDLSLGYLKLARRANAAKLAADRVRFMAGRIERLPFADAAFDFAWCAQSLYSLPDPVAALRWMRRVVRPGGFVAVLENDTLHHILLPWPVEVELAVRQAELAAFRAEEEKPRKFYVGRRLCQVFRAAGLERCREQMRATVRQAPLGTAEQTFFQEYLRNLRERAGPYLEAAMRVHFERLVDPASDHYLLDWPDLSVTCLDHVVWGVKPDA